MAPSYYHHHYYYIHHHYPSVGEDGQREEQLVRLWSHPGQHLQSGLPAGPHLQVQSLRCQQAGRLGAAGQREHQCVRRGGQFSQVGAVSTACKNIKISQPTLFADRID